VESHPFTKPPGNYRAFHYMRGKLLRCEALPPLISGRAAFGRSQSTTFHPAVADSILRYGRTVSGINAKPVACQHGLLTAIPLPPRSETLIC
jgi:hypothetical protein